MGLSTKQVSIDGHGWEKALIQSGTLELPKVSSMKKQSSQQQPQQGEQLKCPRCDSTNTKFCYYNNYNKSQPRHFCKACKRHWTKGGTLRNVPVGGGRKNKRKTSNNATKTTSKIALATNPTTTLSGGLSNNMALQVQPQKLNFPIGALNCEVFYQNFGKQHVPTCSMLESDISLYNKSFNESNNNGGIFLTSTLSLLQNDQDPQFAYSNLGNFESNPCSISPTISAIDQSPNLYNYSRDHQGNAIEEKVVNNNSTNIDLSSSSISDHQQPPWQISSMDLSNNWGWDDFEKFVSVDANLDVPWDDTEIKP